MYDYINRNKRLLQIILLVLIVPPFALFGVDWYFQGGDAPDQVARVAGSRISEQEFSQALRMRQDQLRQMMGGKVDQAMLDSPEVRQAVLDQLIEERVLYTAALKAGMTVPVSELQTVIGDISAFKDDSGKFSPERYRDLLRAQGMSEGMFEASVRKDLLTGRNRQLFAATAFLPNTVIDRLYRLRNQQREVAQLVLNPAQYTAGVKVTDEDAKQYYEANKAQFELPEKVKLQYAMLTLDAVQKRVEVTPEEVQTAYQQRVEQLQKQEERRASHILITAGADATAEQKAKAKEKAQALTDQARKNPKGFAELASKNSEDPGSAAEGGDLGFFPRGRMVKPFEDALWSLKPGEITGPVETQYGYHVIKLEEMRAASVPTFDKVKAEIQDELRKTKASRLFAQEAEEFSNLVYDQPDSLTPVAERFALQPQTTTDWVTRQGGDMPLLSNPKLLDAAFSDGAIKRKQNTEAVEVAPNVLISARVVAYEPAKHRSFDEVKTQIVGLVTQQKAAELARKEGEALLEKLRKGDEQNANWSPPRMVTREKREGLHPEAAEAVFSADASKLPAYTGVAVQDGRYVLYRVSKVVDVEAIDPEQRKQIAQQLEPIAGQEVLAARIARLKQDAEVKVDVAKVQKAS